METLAEAERMFARLNPSFSVLVKSRCEINRSPPDLRNEALNRKLRSRSTESVFGHNVSRAAFLSVIGESAKLDQIGGLASAAIEAIVEAGHGVTSIFNAFSHSILRNFFATLEEMWSQGSVAFKSNSPLIDFGIDA